MASAPIICSRQITPSSSSSSSSPSLCPSDRQDYIALRSSSSSSDRRHLHQIKLSCGKETDNPIPPPPAPEKKKKKKGKTMMMKNKGGFLVILKDLMAPRQKGDIQDVILMSISFALYIYISQKLVCAYCVWQSTFKHH